MSCRYVYQSKVKWMVDMISEKTKSKVLRWEVLYGSEGVHYFGNKFRVSNYILSSLVMLVAIEW